MRTTSREWVGKTDDAMPPPSVRLRILNNNGRKCYLTGIEIQPRDSWDLDHIIALCNGGENRESNLAPALRAPHRDKTKRDRATKRKNDRVTMRAYGIRRTRRSIASPGFPTTEPQRTASKPLRKKVR